MFILTHFRSIFEFSGVPWISENSEASYVIVCEIFVFILLLFGIVPSDIRNLDFQIMPSLFVAFLLFSLLLLVVWMLAFENLPQTFRSGYIGFLWAFVHINLSSFTIYTQFWVFLFLPETKNRVRTVMFQMNTMQQDESFFEDLRNIFSLSTIIVLTILCLILFFMVRSRLQQQDFKISFHVFDCVQVWCFLNVMVQKVYEDAVSEICRDATCLEFFSKPESMSWDWVPELMIILTIFLTQLAIQYRTDRVMYDFTNSETNVHYKRFYVVYFLYSFARLVAPAEFVVAVLYWKNDAFDMFQYVNLISLIILGTVSLFDCVYGYFALRQALRNVNNVKMASASQLPVRPKLSKVRLINPNSTYVNILQHRSKNAAGKME